MRRLLIHFGVSGRLVLNDPRETPVGLNLSRTSADNYELPSNWRSGLLGEVFTFEYGDSLPAPKRSETGEYPVYGSNGVVGTHDTYLTNEPAIIVGRKGSAGALNIASGPSWTTDVVILSDFHLTSISVSHTIRRRYGSTNGNAITPALGHGGASASPTPRRAEADCGEGG